MIKAVVVLESGVYVYYLSTSGRWIHRTYKHYPGTVVKWLLRADVECIVITSTAYVYHLKEVDKA